MRNGRNKRILISIPFFLALIVTGCSGSSTKTETGGGTVKVSYDNITSSFPNMRYEKARNFVFRSRAKMAAHVKARSLSLSSAESLPDVDFEKDMVVLIAVGARSSAGYSVVPISVRADGDKTLIRARERTPPPDSIAASVITYPFLALSVPTRKGPVEVKLKNSD